MKKFSPVICQLLILCVLVSRGADTAPDFSPRLSRSSAFFTQQTVVQSLAWTGRSFSNRADDWRRESDSVRLSAPAWIQKLTRWNDRLDDYLPNRSWPLPGILGVLVDDEDAGDTSIDDPLSAMDEFETRLATQRDINRPYELIKFIDKSTLRLRELERIADIVRLAEETIEVAAAIGPDPNSIARGLPTARAFLVMADALDDLGEKQKAINRAEQGLQWLKQIHTVVEYNPDWLPLWRDSWVRLHCLAGDMLMARHQKDSSNNDLVTARMHYESAFHYVSRILGTDQVLVHHLYDRAAVNSWYLSNDLPDQAGPFRARAREYAGKALAIRRTSGMLTLLAALASVEGRPRESLAFLSEAAALSNGGPLPNAEAQYAVLYGLKNGDRELAERFAPQLAASPSEQRFIKGLLAFERGEIEAAVSQWTALLSDAEQLRNIEIHGELSTLYARLLSAYLRAGRRQESSELLANRITNLPAPSIQQAAGELARHLRSPDEANVLATTAAEKHSLIISAFMSAVLAQVPSDMPAVREALRTYDAASERSAVEDEIQSWAKLVTSRDFDKKRAEQFFRGLRQRLKGLSYDDAVLRIAENLFNVEKTAKDQAIVILVFDTLPNLDATGRNVSQASMKTLHSVFQKWLPTGAFSVLAEKNRPLASKIRGVAARVEHVIKPFLQAEEAEAAERTEAEKTMVKELIDAMDSRIQTAASSDELLALITGIDSLQKRSAAFPALRSASEKLMERIAEQERTLEKAKREQEMQVDHAIAGEIQRLNGLLLGRYLRQMFPGLALIGAASLVKAKQKGLTPIEILEIAQKIAPLNENSQKRNAEEIVERILSRHLGKSG